MSRSLLALALVLLAACSDSGAPVTEKDGPVDTTGATGTPTAPAQPTGTPSPTRPVATGRLRITGDDGGTGPFKLGAVGRIRIEGRCGPMPSGRHTVRLDVLSPSGSIYASIPEEVVVPEGGEVNVSREMRVRGTNIETFRRAGTWRFTLTLDGGEPLAAADVGLTE